MKLIEACNSLKLDLGLTTELGLDELERCIQRAVADLSRHLPRMQVADITLAFAVTDEEFATGATAGTWVTLANRPIEPRTESVKNAAGASFTRDTDYTIDYANGRITHKAGGAMLGETLYLISYTKSRIIVDLGPTAASGCYRIAKVESPAGMVPQANVSVSLWGNLLTILGGAGSQSRLQDNTHLWVYYYTAHEPASVDARATYPAALDEVVCKGALAYALYTLAGKNQQQALVDLASARTALGNIASRHTAIASVRTSIASVHALIVNALSNVNGECVSAGLSLNNVLTFVDLARAAVDKALADNAPAYISPITQARTLLDSVVAGGGPLANASSALDKVHALVQGDASSAKADLDGAIGAAASLGTEVGEAKSAFAGALDALAKVPVHLESGYGGHSAASDLVSAMGVLLQATTTLAKVDGLVGLGGAVNNRMTAAASTFENSLRPWLDDAMLSAKTYLDTGEDKINAVNLGDRVGDLYAKFAEVTVTAADRWRHKLDVYLADAQRQVDAAQTFVAEGGQRISQAMRHVESATTRTSMARLFVEESNARLVAVQHRIALCQARAAQSQAYVQAAQGRLTSAGAFVGEAQQRLSEAEQRVGAARVWLETAGRLCEAARAYTELALVWTQDADRRLGVAKAYTDEAGARNQQVINYLQELAALRDQAQLDINQSTQCQQSAAQYVALAKEQREEALERRNEYLALLGNSAHWRSEVSTVLPSQR